MAFSWPWLDFVSTRHGFDGYTSQPSSHLQTRVTILKSLIFRILRVKYPYIQKQTLIVTTCQSFVFASFWAKSNQIVRNHKFLTFITMNDENFGKFILIFAKISSNYNELNEHIFEFSSIILHVVRTIFTCEQCFIIVTFTRCSNNVYIWTILHIQMKFKIFLG